MRVVCLQWDIQQVLQAVDQYLASELRSSLTIYSSSKAYWLRWLHISERSGLPATQACILAAVSEPGSLLNKRGLMPALACFAPSAVGTRHPCSTHTSTLRSARAVTGAPGCRDCELQRELEQLSPQVLAQLLRGAARCAWALQRGTGQGAAPAAAAPAGPTDDAPTDAHPAQQDSHTYRDRTHGNTTVKEPQAVKALRQEDVCGPGCWETGVCVCGSTS